VHWEANKFVIVLCLKISCSHSPYFFFLYRFGEGNWATIRSFYSNIFDNRSGV